MIYDSLSNINRYGNVKYIDEISRFIQTNNVFDLPHGDIDIKGADLFVKVLKYSPNDSSKNFFETHKDYMDVQIVFRGVELMQFVQPKYTSETNDFKLDGDFTFFKASERISDIIVGENEFTIFFPGEPHKPGCTYLKDSSEILKLVFKVKI
jgi:YhcH/YjgK/YiaL family protein